MRPESPRHLGAVQDAVIGCRRIELGYVARDDAATTRLVDPLGLATKGRVWYLIANTVAGLRTFRVDRITSIAESGESAVRPPGFDVAESWKLISDDVQAKRLPFHASGWMHPQIAGACRYILGEGLRIGPPRADGWIEIGLRGQSARSLAGLLAGFGSSVRVVEPPELIDQLKVLGRQLVDLYSNVGTPVGELPPASA